MKSLKLICLIAVVFAQHALAQTASSPNYQIAYSTLVDEHRDIHIATADGATRQRVTHFTGGNGYSAWSPDGKQIAFYAKYDDKKTWSIHTINIDGTNRKRLTDVKNYWDNSPAWSPDGSKIVFARAFTDAEEVRQHHLWIMNPDGTDKKQIPGLSGGGPYFSPDGQIVYHSQPGPSEIMIANVDGSNVRQLTNNEAEDWHPEVSPDGQKIAFMSNRDGNSEIYVMNIDGSDETRVTFSEAEEDWYPSWSPDGTELLVTNNNGEARRVLRMKADGSDIRIVVEEGSQAAWLKVRNSNSRNSAPESNQGMTGHYFGQKAPGLTPEVFAPDMVSSASSISFSPDLKEAYFTVTNEDEEMAIYFSKLKEGKWTSPNRANFTKGEKKNELYPFVGLNDERIYFTAFDSIFSDERIWYVDRLADAWSDAKPLDSPVNDDLVFYINQSKDGALFYTSISKGKMYQASNESGEFPQVEELELEFGHHGFIAPSQEYMLVQARKTQGEKESDRDIYVCFKDEGGTWSKPINLGDSVNSNLDEGSASITPDGKYLIFNRNGENGIKNYYWVSTQVIENLRPRQTEVNQSSNRN